jgi:hypothetical protein
MKYAIGMGSGDIHIPGFLEIDSGIQKLIRSGGYTDSMMIS